MALSHYRWGTSVGCWDEDDISLPRPLISCGHYQSGGALVFPLSPSLRDIEELLFERGVVVSYETIRR